MTCLIRPFVLASDHWSHAIERAFTLDQSEGQFFPAHNGEGWAIPNVYVANGGDLDLRNLRPAQCRLVAQHLSEDIFYDKLKIAGFVALGVCLTAAALAAAIAVTVCVMHLLIVLAAAFIEIGLALTGHAFLVGFVCGAVGTYVFAYVELNILGLTVTAVASIWNKEILPHVINGARYVSHRTEQIRHLEFLAV